MDFYIGIIVLHNPIGNENFRKEELQMPILSKVALYLSYYEEIP